ncbi:MAG: thioesterase family protein [Mycobacteriales bacterium]
MQLDLDGRWAIGGKIHGGYLLRQLAAAVVTERHPHPLAVSAHFLRAPDAGAASIETQVLRDGRRVTQSRAVLSQEGTACVESLVTTGLLHAGAQPFWSRTAPPELPPAQDCVHMVPEPAPGFRIGHLEFVDVRADPATVSFASGVPGEGGRVAAWVTVPGMTVLDLLVVADALAPVTFDLGVPGWVPTVELTAYVRAVPAPGPLRVEQRARLLEDGWLDEDCDVWDSTGRLVCQARQLAGYRAPG